jgi:phage-related protein
MADIWINDRDLADFGACQVTRLSNWSDIPARQAQGVQIAGRAGTWLATPITTSTRQLQVEVYFKPASLASRKTELDAFFLALEGVVEVRINDDPNRFAYARVESTAMRGASSASLLAPECFVGIMFVSTDPYFYAKSADAATILCDGATWTTLPLGTAPQGGVLRLVGAGTSPCVVTVADRAGTVRYTMTLTTTWTSAEYVDIDCDQWTITKWNNTTSTNIITALGAAETFPIFDPGDASQVKISNAVAAIYYGRKAYLS